MNKNKISNMLVFFLFTVVLSFFIIGFTNYKAATYRTTSSDSILRWAINENDSINDNDYYALSVNGITYNIHTYVFYGDQVWDENKTFGDANDVGSSSTDAQNMVMVIVKGDLTIEEGATITAYKGSYGGPKGLFLYVSGTIINNGTISMTGKGAKANGENVYLWKDESGNYEFVPATGSSGGLGTTSGGDKGVNGNNGIAATGRQTGGGGGGANTYSSYNSSSTKGGQGGTGTSYSGGAGAGGGNHGWSTISATNGNSYKGGSCYGVNSSNRCQTGVGVTTGTVSGSGVVQTNLGSGGLLIVFAPNVVIGETGVIESQGVSPAAISGHQQSFTYGGASGGGSINIFASAYKNEGTISTFGGTGLQGSGSISGRRSKSGDGGAGSFTYYQVILDENLIDPKLKELNVDKGTLSLAFDPEIFDYTLNLNSEQSKVNVTALPLDDYKKDMTISGDGLHYVDVGNGKITVTITSKYGFVNVYTINTTRPMSSYKYLDGITIDGKEISGFNPTTLTYDIYLEDFQDEIDVQGIRARTNQVITNNGTVKAGTGLTVTTLTVLSEDGSGSSTYNLRLHRNHNALLKSLEVYTTNHDVLYELTPEFSYSVYNYNITLPYNEIDLDIVTDVYDDEAKVTITGDKLMIAKSGDIVITVNEPNVINKVYKIHYEKEAADAIKATYDYNYSGNYETFIAPYTGIYSIELWGAQGGGTTSLIGGRGGYTKGEIKLNKDDKLYIYVGATTSTGTGGYNGGGTAVGTVYGGGGATDIRTVPGTWNEFYSLKSRIMVAAGGGGYGMSYVGGYGGGLTGGNGSGNEPGYGGSQTAGGKAVANGGSNTAGKFGIGGTGSWSNEKLGGGGGGYYGGSSGGGTNNNGSGGGGSSYISGHDGSNSVSADSESSKITHTGSSMHHSGLYFENTVMIDGAGFDWTTVRGSYVGQPNPETEETQVGQTGNGFARITPTAYSKNNYLMNIESDIGTLSPTFDPLETDYTITLDKYTKEFTLSGELADTSAIVTGFGHYDIKVGETKNIPITVTAQNGDIRVYNVSVTRLALLPGEHSSKLIDLTIENNTYELKPEFESEVYEYEIEIPYNLISLDVDYTAFDRDATITVSGNGYIKTGKNGQITVTVTNPYCETTVYTIKLTREGDIVDSEWEYDYTGEYQTFVAPYTGYYEIELWGAAGQYGTTYKTGLGAYTKGKIWLTKNTTLYVYVGNRVTTSNGFRFNGGGAGGSGTGSNNTKGAGGGATDIRIVKTSTASTWDEFESLKSRIMVAAGGGGHDRGGAGGALVGLNGGYHPTPGSTYNGFGGTQIVGGKANTRGGTAGGFGYGGTGLKYSDGHGGGGGGGGWYGGSGAKWHAGGGGGSSYISGHLGSVGVSASSTASNIIPLTTGVPILEDSYSYTGYIFEETEMIAGNQQMPGKTSGYMTGNNGNGFARITKLPDPSTNNFLSNITVEVNGETREYTPEYEFETEDYYLELDPEETRATLKARPEDSKATIEGLGDIMVPAGEDNIYEIKVTAESGDEKVYRVHIKREASSNPYPLNITVSGLVPSLCSVDYDSTIDYCVLDPLEFDKNTHDYYVTVPARIQQLWFDVVKGHDYQNVTGDGKQLLEGWENTITITVESEDGTNKEEYRYHVTRDMNGNTDLSDLVVLDPQFDLNFDPDVFSYYLTVPNEYETYQFNEEKVVDKNLENVLQIYAKADDENAKLSIIGDGTLNSGMNEIDIVVLAQNGNVRIYNLNVYREKNSNVFLSNITIKNGTTNYDLKPKFNKLYFGVYQVTVPNEVTSVTIDAEAEVPSTSYITGDIGTKNLKVGNNLFNITVTAEDGSVETYQVNINRKKNSNANLSSITVSDEDNNYLIDPPFNKDFLIYDVTVDEGVTNITITATTEVDTTTYKLIDNNNLKVGKNVKRVMAIAEDGTTKTYTINITRPANSDNYLFDLKVTNGSEEYLLTPEFVSNTWEENGYTLEVPNNITNVKVTGTKSSNLSTVTGNGNYSLNVGENNISIRVKAETGAERIYELTINRKPDNNAYLSMITTTQGILVPTFDKETFNYTINVEDDINNIALTATPESNKTTVTPKTKTINNLETGTTEVDFVTTAEDGTILTYTVEIIKDKSGNDNASLIVMEEGALIPEFNSNIVSYKAYVPNDITNGTFHVTLEDEKASYVILNNKNFKVGENEVTVRITSESGEDKDYVITVIRQEEEQNSNYLTSLTLSTGTLSPTFNKETEFYEVEVPYKTNNISVLATAEDKNAQVIGAGNYDLEVGENVIVVTVTGQDGKIRDYQVLVTRKKNDEARLETLSLKTTSLSPAFDSDTYEYDVTVRETSVEFSKILPIDSNATYEILDNYFTKVGDYEVTIRVTAHDGETTKDYVLNVHKEPSYNNNLEWLEVVGYNITPEFDKSRTLYTLTVPNDVNSVLIYAKTEEENATINGDGSRMLQVGANNLVVEVISESGTIKSYTVSVTREGSSDNSLIDLLVNNGTMTPLFTNSNNYYDVTIPYEETYVDLTVILNHDLASYTVKNNNDLKVGQNTVTVFVTAENGEVNTITLNVTREEIVSALLEDITLANYRFNETFNSNNFNYSVQVNNETDTLDKLMMNVITLDKKATWEITGDKTFEVGNNIVQIEVTSSDGIQKQIYTIIVERLPETNNYLDYLYTSEGDVTPLFKRDIMNYEILVDNDVTEIELIGDVQDKSSTVTGLGLHELQTGENMIPVVVTAFDGNSRTYYVKVIRAKADENYLLTLEVKDGNTGYALTPDFDKQIQEYTLTVPVGLQKVTLTGTVSEGATVTGLDTVELHAFDNDITIEVTSESGTTREYNLTIIRPPSNNNRLIDLVPSVGTLSPGFTYNNTDYTIYLDSSAATLSFGYSKEDLNAIVTGTEEMLIPDGTSTREIVVTAEDGTSIRTYTITVVKERSDNANLASLEVTGYPFVETFDKDTLEYHITVPNSKKTLTASDVIATTEDNNARVTKLDSLSLSTNKENEYVITVTAPDKFTTKTYKIFVTRELGSESKALDIKVNIGRLTSKFTENTKEYEWKVPKETTIITKENVEVILKDENSTLIMPDEIDLEETSIYTIRIESEDGTTFNEYNLNISKNLSSEASLTSLSVDKGRMTPEFDSTIFVYDVYEYDDVDSVNVDATAPPNVYITSGLGEVELTEKLTIHEVVIEAEDGTEVIYTLNIHKTVPHDGGLKKIGLNNLDKVECIGSQCILTPVFNKNTYEYDIKVPNEYDKLSVFTQTLYDTQSVKVLVKGVEIEDNDYLLPVGVTEVTIKVYDGLGSLTDTYTLNVNRSKSDNNYLKSLRITNLETDEEKIEEYELDKEFDKKALEYTIYVPSDVDEVKIIAETEDADAKVTSINGYNYLEDGVNDASIVVTSPSGEQRTYIVHIVKSSEYNSYLQNITISTGVFWDLSPKFSPTTFDYTTTITSTSNKITIGATTVDSTTEIIEGLGEYELEIGVNTIVIKTEAANGKQSEYTVNIIKLVSSNVNIESLTVEEGDLNPEFIKGTNTTNFEVNVASTVDKLTMHITLEDPNSSYIVTGNENLVSGDNVVNIIVMNSNKTASKTYQITVHKAKDTNNLLTALRVYDDTKDYQLTPDFDNKELEYNVTIPHDIAKVSIEALSASESSFIAGDGLHYLDYGSNKKLIVVTAEDGTTSIYTIDIYREYDLRLKSLVSNVGNLEPEFNSEQNNYTINLANNVDEITLIGEAISNKVTVEGNQTYSLNTQDNNIKITVKDPDGNENVYTINVIREQDNNNYLKEVLVTGFLTPVFDRDIQEYQVDVRKDVTELDFTSIIPEVDTSTYEILNNSLSGIDTENIVTIRVESEEGNTRDYVFKVTRRDDEFFSNRLLSLTVSEGELTPDFNPDVNNYIVTVPNSINEITIEVIKEDAYATVTGAGKVSLVLGRNVIPIKVTDKKGKTNTYTVIVYREESPDATLKSLIVKNQTFIPIFNKLQENYTLTVDSDVTSLDIEALPTDPSALVKISGNSFLVNGENTITITVTAPDGITTKTYTITVTKSSSKNNYLSSLEVLDYSFDREFDKIYQGPYTVEVGNDINSIYIEAIPEDSSSIVTNDGVHNIKTGKNTILVDVASEDGSTRTYTVIVNKKSSTDGTLKDILLSDGTLEPVFDKDTFEYKVVVPSELDSITVTGVVNSISSSITGNGTYNLTENETEIKLVVTSEDGVETTYTIKVEKDVTNSSKLASLVVKDGELTPHFHKLITGYTIYVTNEVTSLNLDYVPEDEEATVVVSDNNNFKVGTNKVLITVTSKDGSSTTTYDISVIRQTMAATYLQTLEVEGYTLTPYFEKEIMYYEVTVPQDIETINIKATAEDSSATVIGTGIQTLSDGENRFYVTVESTSGVIRSYQILVNRQMSSENKLLTLTHDVGTIIPDFDPETNDYMITVPAGTKEINLDGTVSENSIVTGLGKVLLSVGEQTRLITVTSQSGEVNVYTIKIVRPVSTNTELVDLIPSAGELEYTNDETEYEIEVNDNVNVISFNAILVDENATIEVAIPIGEVNEGEEQPKIIVDDLATIDYGTNNFIITVTAEDGVTTRIITVKVIKNKDLISIEASEDEILLAVDEEENLSYTLNPTDTSYKDVEWISLDENIATVDSNGKVTAVGIGGTQIKVVSKYDDKIYDIVNVNVISKVITSSVYDINRFDNPENDEVNHVIGIEPLTTLKDFIPNFDNNPSMLHVYDSEGNEITDEEQFIGTFMTIKLELEGKLLDELAIVVRGDLTGDGLVMANDLVAIKNITVGRLELTYLLTKAADITLDEFVMANDTVAIKNYLVGKGNLN